MNNPRYYDLPSKILKFCEYVFIFSSGALTALLLVNYLSLNTTFAPDNWDDKTAYGFWTKHNSTDSYFCVWTDNRWHKDIENTYYHEACHELIHHDYDHFCGGDVHHR